MEKISNRVYFVIIAVFVILFAYFLTKSSKEYERITQLKKEENYYVEEINKLNNEKEEIRKRQEMMDTDEIIESTARDKLDMVRPNERVYVIED